MYEGIFKFIFHIAHSFWHRFVFGVGQEEEDEAGQEDERAEHEEGKTRVQVTSEVHHKGSQGAPTFADCLQEVEAEIPGKKNNFFKISDLARSSLKSEIPTWQVWEGSLKRRSRGGSSY